MRNYLTPALIVGLLFFSCNQGAKKNEAGPPMVAQSFAEAIKRDPSIVLIDVRTPSEVQEGIIAGAVNLDFISGQFEKSIDSLDRNKQYFIYCAVGKRSGKARQMMIEKGFTKTEVLEGGLDAWVAAGLPLAKP